MSNSKPGRRPRAFPGLDAEVGPALPLSSADTRWLIEQAVERALAPEVTRHPRALGLRKLSLAAIVVVTSAAAATVVHQKLQKVDVANGPAVHATQQPTKKIGAPKLHPRAAEASEAPSAEAAPPANAAPATNSATPPMPHASPSVAPEVAVVDELSAANDLRRRAQWRAAEAAYRSIAAVYPRAQQAAVAQLAAAELRLDHLSDAAGALRMYRAVPRNSALGVEALFGISRAERALGNRDAEAAALRTLLDEYPTSLQADGARARLKQLSTESTRP